MLRRRRSRGSPDPSTDRDLVVGLANEHLARDVAARWLELLRPALRLRRTLGGEAVVARLGGLPELPPSVGWPTWDGHGPLSFIASLDCATIDHASLDIALPSDGALLFFYFDGHYNNYESTVGYWEPETLAGARSVYVAADELAMPTECPAGITPYTLVELAADEIVTFPSWEHPDLQAAFRREGEETRAFLDHPVIRTRSSKRSTSDSRRRSTRSAATPRRCKVPSNTKSHRRRSAGKSPGPIRH